jgi:hypothetical protein
MLLSSRKPGIVAIGYLAIRLEFVTVSGYATAPYELQRNNTLTDP